MESGNKHVQRSEQTRARLVSAARELFAREGYAAVSTEDVVRRAGLTRGALYHQFAGKRDLFAVVFEQVEAELAERIAGAALGEGRAADPLAALARAVDLFLDACLEPEAQRIALVDAPAVLGWDEWRAVGSRYGLGILKGALEAAMEAGQITRAPVTPLAHVLLGALDEAGLYVARAEDVERARAEVGDTLRRLIAGLAG